MTPPPVPTLSERLSPATRATAIVGGALAALSTLTVLVFCIVATAGITLGAWGPHDTFVPTRLAYGIVTVLLVGVLLLALGAGVQWVADHTSGDGKGTR